MNDHDKLLVLACWFDAQDAVAGQSGDEVQKDLRRIAGRIRDLEAERDRLREAADALLAVLEEHATGSYGDAEDNLRAALEGK